MMQCENARGRYIVFVATLYKGQGVGLLRVEVQ